MFVRAATIEDLNTLVEFGKRICEESPIFRTQPIDLSSMRKFFGDVIDRSNSIFLVLDEYQNPVGGIVAMMCKDWRTGQSVAFEQGMYVLPEYRNGGAASQLITTFVEWAKLQGAERVQLGTVTDIHADKTIKLYESHGFELRGYVLEMGA